MIKIHQRVISIVLALALILSMPCAVGAVESVSAVSASTVPLSIWYKIEEITDGIADETADWFQVKADYIAQYMKEHSDATYWDAQRAFDDIMNGVKDGGHTGGTFDYTPTDEHKNLWDDYKDRLYKIFCRWVLNNRGYDKIPPAFQEHKILEGIGEGYYTYEMYIDRNEVIFNVSPVGTTDKYKVHPYGFILRFYDTEGNLQLTRQYYVTNGYYGSYAEGLDNIVFSLSYDAQKQMLHYEYGERTMFNGFKESEQWIGIPHPVTNPEPIEPGVYNPNIPDYYKIPGSDPETPVYFDPITNNYYDFDKNIITYNDFYTNINPSDEEKAQFDELYNLIQQFETAQISYDCNALALMTEILEALKTIDGTSGTPSMDYTEILNKINATLVTLCEKTPNLAPVISQLEEIKMAVKELSIPNYSSKLKDLCDKMNSMLTKLDIITALLGVDVAADLLGELTDEESEFLDAFASVATALLNILPTAVIEGTLVSLQSVLLDDSAPPDITIDCNVVTEMGEIKIDKMTVLSTKNLSGWTEYIDLMKIFVSFLLIYGWLKIMRSKVSDIFGG